MKASASRFLRLCLRSLPLSLAALSLGCQSTTDWSLTYKLWNNDSFQNFKMPAPEPRLELFADECHSDVLVVYDEFRENDGAVYRRAFFANRNLDRIRAGRKPHFVSSSASEGLTPIPILRPGSREKIPATGLSVLMMENRQDFVMYSDGGELGPVLLPTYSSTGGVKKTLLTPLTVTGDTIIVGTMVGLYAALAYVQSGGSFGACH